LRALTNDLREAARLGGAGILLSVALHLATFASLGRVRVEAALPRIQEIEVSVIEEQPAPPAPEPVAEPEPEPEPVKPRAPREASPRPVEKAPPSAEPPAAAEETLADLTGTTLTGESAGGWVSAVGSGAAMTGPIGKVNAAVTGRNRDGVEGGVLGGTGTRVVSEADLSRRPQPPAADELDAALERNYPKSAKQQGIEGVARIKLRVLANGKLQALGTVSETHPGFGDACKASVRDTSWGPGLDRKHQPVATDIIYKCEFSVE
jgi:outer membrane biosynthesis protein TonB